jgi:hypothetical protein
MVEVSAVIFIILINLLVGYLLLVCIPSLKSIVSLMHQNISF